MLNSKILFSIEPLYFSGFTEILTKRDWKLKVPSFFNCATRDIQESNIKSVTASSAPRRLLHCALCEQLSC